MNWTGLAEQWLPRVIEERADVRSADAAYSALREMGMPIPRQYVREAWREQVIAQNYLPLINRMADEEIIPRRWFQSTEQRFTTPFAYKVRIRGTELETGQPLEKTVTIGSDIRYMVGEIREFGDYWAATYDFDMFISPPTVEITGVLHRAGARWD